MLVPGRRTLATTYPPGRIVSGTFGPTSTTRPKFSCPMTRKSAPGGAAPYSASLISLSVPSTPTRSTSTRTPLPPGTSSTLGRGISSRWIEFGLPGVTAIAFMPFCLRLLPLRYGLARRRRGLRSLGLAALGARASQNCQGAKWEQDHRQKPRGDHGRGVARREQTHVLSDLAGDD